VISSGGDKSTQQQPALSTTEISRRVAATWTDVLGPGADRPGAIFFELNGQSIAAVRIVAAIEDELGITVDLGDLFEDPDLETLTRDIVARSGDPVG
jgi:acyl carrier protein